jgi:uncharacterized protein with PQ loop repeat
MEIIGWIGGIFLSLCAIPEMLRAIKDKRCYIGHGMLFFWGVGEICLFIYEFKTMAWARIINYLFNIICISILYYYKLKRPTPKSHFA